MIEVSCAFVAGREMVPYKFGCIVECSGQHVLIGLEGKVIAPRKSYQTTH